MTSLSFKAKLYLCLTFLAGLLLFIAQIGNVDFGNPWLLVTLCVFGSLALILKVEGPTNRSHYTFSYIIYAFAFAVLGTSGALVVIVASNITEWIWNKPPWYIQLFNTTSYIIVIQMAGATNGLINPGHSAATLQTVLGIFAGMVVFNFLNHLMIGVVLWLAREESFKESGVFDFFSLVLDLALLTFGASLSFVWHFNPYALGLFLVPLYLMYSTLRVPALERKTEIDSKTGLFNHEYFKKQLATELVRANRFDRPLSIILADLDLLRNINNTYGHLAGDEVLIGVAKAMKNSVRDYDVVCRFGGEEFAVLLPETSISQAHETAELLRKTIENTEFTIPTSITPIRVTMSFGVSQRENFSQNTEQITHNADLALYHSKLSGRNKSFAYIDEAYVDFHAHVHTHPEIASQEPIHTQPLPHTNAPATKQIATAVVAEPLVNLNDDLLPEVNDSEYISPKSNDQPKRHPLLVNGFIGLLAGLSILLFLSTLHYISLARDISSVDWVGLTVLALLIAVAENFSIDLYIKQTAVSTSAIPLLVAFLIIGPIGAFGASLILAISLLIKYRSPLNRFVFNFSNHLLAGTFSSVLVLWAGGNYLGLPALSQILLSLGAALISYLSITWMVAVGMSLEMNQPSIQIWKEQFSWLAPFYIGTGFIAYALTFGYIHNHITGLIIMIIPMVLLRVSQKQYIDRTRQVVMELREKNQMLNKRSEEIGELNEGLLSTLSEIIDLRDPFVLGHSKQVGQYAATLAKMLKLSERQVELVRKAGLLHDIGKLGISMEILTKPGKLTTEDYETIKKHAVMGSDLIKNSPSLRPIASIIRHHHEHYNGQGYPDCLAGNQIAIEARIVAVADAVEAMSSDRPYRKALRTEKIIEELNRNSGTQFDPLVVKEAVQLVMEDLAGEVAPTYLVETEVELGPRLVVNAQAS